MKTTLNYLLTVVFLLICSSHITAKNNSLNKSTGLAFLENKGQVRDQNGGARNDIQYALQSGGISIFIGNGQVHYQFVHAENNKECIDDDKSNEYHIPGLALARSRTIETYRMDVELTGANISAVAESGEQNTYYENYYVHGCPADGVQVHTCNRITYKNVYPGIDWVFLIKGNKLEHEFVVGPGADASQIKLKYSGQTSLQVNEDGGITATTPMGTIKEHAPLCYNPAGKLLPSGFRLQDNVLTYDVNDYKGALVIDPVVEWGTYYGFDSSTSPFYAVACDANAMVYASGLTYSTVNIATTGSFQDTLNPSPDAYLVKFDSSGNRLWGTYYGGGEGNWGTAVAVDDSGFVYLGGTTASPANIATPGSQQPVFGGGEWDGFLVKFDSLGVRKWGTYIGGSGSDIPASVSCDHLGHVYISGFTTSSNNIATPGSFKSAGGGYNMFLVQYDTLGVRQWGTFYGGSDNQFGGVCCTDGTNAYLAGWTLSATGISSPGCYQPALSGPNDAFIVKFDQTGARQWATYYGSESTDQTGGIASDGFGVYLMGTTYGNTGIATPGCFQPTRGGGADAFLTKFDLTTGFPVWGTYYGGPGDETTDLSRISCNISVVFIAGVTLSLSGLASAGAWQSTYGGGDDDAYVAGFENSGNELWSTYLGGSGIDEARAIASDGSGFSSGVYVCGQTTSTSAIATPDGYLPTGGGGGTGFDYQGFMVKFHNAPLMTTSVHTNQELSNIGIYPSPNNGTFTLAGAFGNVDGSVQITIADITGRIVMKDEAMINNGTLNKPVSLGSVSPGLYLLTAVSKGQTSVLKFVVE